jgi:hypothetical protein
VAAIVKVRRHRAWGRRDEPGLRQVDDLRDVALAPRGTLRHLAESPAGTVGRGLSF